MKYKTFLKLKLLSIENMREVMNPLGIFFNDSREYFVHNTAIPKIDYFSTQCPVKLLKWIQTNNGKNDINIQLEP